MSELNRIRDGLQSAYFKPEQNVVENLLDSLNLDDGLRARINSDARLLVSTLRNSPSDGLMEEFLVQYQLSTSEGIALMCLAEAYLRTPDAPTLDELIKDKIGKGNWSEPASESQSTLVNLSAWALIIGGRVLREREVQSFDLGYWMRQVIQRLGEPIARIAIGQAMRLLGQQFVLGSTIDAAISRGRTFERRGYTYSYDMLGEAARTAHDARKYFEAYSRAIEVIQAHAVNQDIHKNPSISVKLSALHPRYEYNKIERLLKELVPRLIELIEQASQANIGLTIDAEEADRLDLSLSLVEAALRNAKLGSWQGFGMAIQAYSKQAPFVIDWIHELARLLELKIAVRLVKGAYWDSEIKNSQVLGMDSFPVFTRKESTDLCYLNCAKRIFDYSERVYPQFATHNAHTAMAVLQMSRGRTFEFQRLHGMGESLHDIIMEKWGCRCRIYAPVGVHEDLLAYLVRRLLENGANSSFIHQLRDEDVPADDVARDPLDLLDKISRFANPAISSGRELFAPNRTNSTGWNLDNPVHASKLDEALQAYAAGHWRSSPIISGHLKSGSVRSVFSPSRIDQYIGEVADAGPELVDQALTAAVAAFPDWSNRSVETRAQIADKIAELYETHTVELLALAALEAGKTRLDGVLEIREAVDFCRYYAVQARELFSDGFRSAIGPFVCISPWNFPLAIFTGQIIAALVCGNTVVAKPAERTSLMAARAVELMIEAGVPGEVLSLLPGDGSVIGNKLTRDRRVAGVCFTGSTQTAEIIDRNMADFGNALAPLIAETGGLNTMIADSTALPEQVVRDVVSSAFQSAGQRCSALRILCVQEDCAEIIIDMLKGAMAELSVGDPYLPQTDIGPVIDQEAFSSINAHCARLDHNGDLIYRCEVSKPDVGGYFVPPAVYHLNNLEDLKTEVFGPVLHVVTFESDEFERLVDRINQMGYGLTMGIHSRIDGRIDQIVRRARIGNIYVNRNQIGAVVGVQPFGGEGKSGTGPKAGGPNYLRRFTKSGNPVSLNGNDRSGVDDKLPGEEVAGSIEAKNLNWLDWRDRNYVLVRSLVQLVKDGIVTPISPLLDRLRSTKFEEIRLYGPTGERNRLSYRPRGRVLCAGGEEPSLLCSLTQICLALAAGNIVLTPIDGRSQSVQQFRMTLLNLAMPQSFFHLLPLTPQKIIERHRPNLILFDGNIEEGRALRKAAADFDGARTVMMNSSDDLSLLAIETVVSEDTTAAGGNASLLAAQN